MATNKKTKKTPDKKDAIKKSLEAASTILNDGIHRPVTSAMSAGGSGSHGLLPMNEKLFEVTLHQAFCNDEQLALGLPTTDFQAAKNLAVSHHQRFHHVTDVIDSN